MKKLRLVIITQGLSFIVQPLFSSDDAVVGIVESAPRDYVPESERSVKSRLIKFIQKYSGIESLQHFAKRQDVPYILLTKNNHDAVEKCVREWKPDLIVVSSMSQLLRRSIFDIPPLGTINIHSAKLPAYRGPNPTLWMYYDMELNPAVTVHYIDEGEDTGDIIEQDTFSLPIGATMAEYLSREYELALKLLNKAIDRLRLGKVQGVKQPQDSPTVRARNITAEEAGGFIPWDKWSVEHVWHFLRGEGDSYPFICQPKGLYKGQLWRYVSYEKKDERHTVGKIYQEGKRYYLACKDGRIELDWMFSGKRFLKMILGM